MIKLIADSTCDLSDEWIEKYDIGIAPLTIRIEEKDYRDRIDITPNEFFAKLEGLSKHPTTAMPSPNYFLELFESAVEKGYSEILCICMSSGTSGSYQSAEIAKNMFFEIEQYKDFPLHVVDSRSMSHGSGWMIIKCIKLMEKGFTFDELVDFCETYKTHIKHFLSVDDLNHLLRSGRLTNGSAFIGKLLKIKPIMSMRDGKGAIVAKERGRKNVLDHYVKEFNARVDEELSDFVIIGYTSDYQYAQNLELKMRNETGFKGEIYLMQMGVSVGTHVGLGGLSMFFLEKDRKHDGLLVNELNQINEKRKKLIDKIRKSD